MNWRDGRRRAARRREPSNFPYPCQIPRPVAQNATKTGHPLHLLLLPGLLGWEQARFGLLHGFVDLFEAFNREK